jgi:hypothetical protein
VWSGFGWVAVAPFNWAQNPTSSQTLDPATRASGRCSFGFDASGMRHPKGAGGPAVPIGRFSEPPEWCVRLHFRAGAGD